MTTALETFRDISLNPLVGGTDIDDVTGDAAPCGFIPDVWGNNAYFNNVCANSISPVAGISLPATQFASARTGAPVTVASTTLPFQIANLTVINQWLPSQANFGLPVIPTGIQLTSIRATYLVTYWLPGVGGSATAAYEIFGALLFDSSQTGNNFLEMNGVSTYVANDLQPVALFTWQFINLGIAGLLKIALGQNSGSSISISTGGVMSATVLNTF